MTPSFKAFAERLPGRVLTPSHPDFANETAAFNLAVVHRPELVVAAHTAADVVEAVRFARAQGLRLSVQATGHGAHAPIEGGLLISTRRLDAVTVEPARGTALIGGGARWAAVIAAAAAHGLAPITGSSSTVGVVGYLLGGGLGPLARSHGFSSDYLVSLDVVTGAGDLVRASAVDHADLFWALRGGKCGLGVVTAARLRLVPMPALYAGALFFAEAHIEATLRGWLAWTAGADARVTTSAAIIRFPPFEAVPTPLRGRRLLSLRFAFPGDADEGARLAAPLRALAPVYLDELGVLPPAEVARIHSDPPQPGPSWVAGMLFAHADQAFASVLLAHCGSGTDSPFLATEVRHIGAAAARDVAEGSAVGGRPATFTLALISADPARFADAPAAADRLRAELAPWQSAETNINFAVWPPTAEHRQKAWPAATWARLAEVRRRYDPANLMPFG